MFTTHELNRINSHNPLLTSAHQGWSLVSLHLNCPYFLVSYQTTNLQGVSKRTDLVWTLSDLMELCDYIKQNTHGKIFQIAMLKDGGLKAEIGWQLSNLREIWTANDPGQQHCFVTYFTEDGTTYLDKAIDVGKELLEPWAQVFKADPV